MADVVDAKDFLGNKKVMVGTGKSDIVLNTLGNIWIKTGRKTVKLSEYFPTTTSNSNSIYAIQNIDEVQKSNGKFYYDLSSGLMYAYINNELISLNALQEEKEEQPVDSTTTQTTYEIPKDLVLDSITVKNIIFDEMKQSDNDIIYTKNNRVLQINSSIETLPSNNNDELYCDYLSIIDTDDVVDPLYINDTTTLQDVSPYNDYKDYKEAYSGSSSWYDYEYLKLEDYGTIVQNKYLYTSSFDLSDKYDSSNENENEFEITIIIPNYESENEDDELKMYFDGIEDSLSGDDYTDGIVSGTITSVYATTFISNKPIYIKEIKRVVDVNSETISLFSESFNKEIYTLYERNGFVYKYYRYYNDFLGDFISIENIYDVGDIITDGSNYAVVTNVIGDISIARLRNMNSIFEGVSSLDIVGNIFNGYDCIINNKVRYGVNRLYINDDYQLNAVIQTNFETDFEYNGNYYYIYTENFLRDGNGPIITNKAIVSVGDEINIVFKESGTKITINEGDYLKVCLSGLPTTLPEEKGLLYIENGFIKISE